MATSEQLWDFYVKAARTLIDGMKEVLDNMPDENVPTYIPNIVKVESDPALFKHPYHFQLVVVTNLHDDDKTKDWSEKYYLELAIVDCEAMYKYNIWLVTGSIEKLKHRFDDDLEIWRRIATFFRDGYEMMISY